MFHSSLAKMDFHYQIWKWGIIFTDNVGAIKATK